MIHDCEFVSTRGNCGLGCSNRLLIKQQSPVPSPRREIPNLRDPLLAFASGKSPLETSTPDLSRPDWLAAFTERPEEEDLRVAEEKRDLDRAVDVLTQLADEVTKELEAAKTNKTTPIGEPTPEEPEDARTKQTQKSQAQRAREEKRRAERVALLSPKPKGQGGSGGGDGGDGGDDGDYEVSVLSSSSEEPEPRDDGRTCWVELPPLATGSEVLTKKQAADLSLVGQRRAHNMGPTTNHIMKLLGEESVEWRQHFLCRRRERILSPGYKKYKRNNADALQKIYDDDLQHETDLSQVEMAYANAVLQGGDFPPAFPKASDGQLVDIYADHVETALKHPWDREGLSEAQWDAALVNNWGKDSPFLLTPSDIVALFQKGSRRSRRTPP